MAILTLTTFMLGGFLREQVCIYMCPWPRIQSAMLDEKSLIVTYKDWRGEPRRRMKKAARKAATSAIASIATQCVAVCPTGIDIREGPQIGCITCALCIDACDQVMDKIGRPKGLISYTTLTDYATNTTMAKTLGRDEATRKQVVPGWREVIRPRTMIYLALWSGIGLAMLVAITLRDRVDLHILHDRNPQYVELSNGDIRNGYTVKLSNMEAKPKLFDVGLIGLPGAVMWSPEIDVEPSRKFVVSVPPDQVSSIRLFIAADPDNLPPLPDARRDRGPRTGRAGIDTHNHRIRGTAMRIDTHPTASNWEIRGKHVAVFFLLFFGTIFTVNFTMAGLANQSWTGLIAKNGYVASKDLAVAHRKRRLALAVGWTLDISIDDDEVVLDFDGVSKAATGATVTVVAERPLNEERGCRPEYGAERYERSAFHRVIAGRALDHRCHDDFGPARIDRTPVYRTRTT